MCILSTEGQLWVGSELSLDGEMPVMLAIELKGESISRCRYYRQKRVFLLDTAATTKGTNRKATQSGFKSVGWLWLLRTVPLEGNGVDISHHAGAGTQVWCTLDKRSTT